MEKRYINPRTRFFFAPNPIWLWDFKGLSFAAKYLYGILAYHAGEDGLCYPSVTLLAVEMGVTKRYISSLVSELIETGLVETEIYKGENSAGQNLYKFPELDIMSSRTKYNRKEYGTKPPDIDVIPPCPTGHTPLISSSVPPLINCSAKDISKKREVEEKRSHPIFATLKSDIPSFSIEHIDTQKTKTKTTPHATKLPPSKQALADEGLERLMKKDKLGVNDAFDWLRRIMTKKGYRPPQSMSAKEQAYMKALVKYCTRYGLDVREYVIAVVGKWDRIRNHFVNDNGKSRVKEYPNFLEIVFMREEFVQLLFSKKSEEKKYYNREVVIPAGEF